MLKKFILLLCLVAPLMAIAQDKIAYVNSQEIMSKMPEMKEIQTKMEAKYQAAEKTFGGIQSEYQVKLEEYGKKLDNFNKGDNSVTEAEMMDLQKAVTQFQERLETYVQTSRTNLEKEQSEMMAPIQEKILKAIKEVGDEQGYTYIIEAGVLLYTNPTTAADANKHLKTKLGIVD